MKRIVLLLLMTFIVNVGAWASDFEFGGISYNVTSSSDLTVEVTYSDNNYSGDVVIPSSVTYIGTTYSVTSIGERAFSGCSGLTSVVIPSSVTGIGWSAFSGCSGLTSVVIPSSVTSIGSYAFSNVTRIDYTGSLEEWCNKQWDPTYISYSYDLYINGKKVEGELVIPSSVTEIGERAFWGCSGLTSVVIPSSVTKIEWNAFSNVTRIDYTGSLEEWCNKQWDPTRISYSYDLYINGKKVEGELVIPSSVTEIGYGAFNGCGSLTSVVIPSSVTKIGGFAFSNVTRIDYTGSLEEWCNKQWNPTCISYSYDLYINGNKVEGELVIPSSVTSIGERAFYGCSGLTSVTIPSSVTEIGEMAFFSCSGLTSVVIPSSVTEIGSSAFYGCDGLTSVVIPSSVTSIGSYAFEDCSGLTSVTIPSSVTSIGEKAFYGCDKIRTMVIGSGLERLPEGILDNPIKSLTLYGTTPYSVSGYSSTSLPGCYANCEVYVPEEAYEAYYYDGFWGYFNLQVIGDPTINVVGNKGGTVGRVSYENNVLTLSVTPDDGNVVDKIYVDNTVVYGSVNKWAPVMDVFVVVNNDGTIDIHNVTKENVVSVSFKKSVEVPTSIAEIISGEQEALEIYDLQGRKLSKPQKGINIIDGKKVIVK